MKKNLFMAFVAFATIAFVGCEKKTEPTPTPTPDPTPSGDAKVVLDQHALELAVGEQAKLRAALNPAKENLAVTFTSDNKEVATVSAAGLVDGIAAGKVNIIASAEGYKSDTCVVTVVDASDAFAWGGMFVSRDAEFTILNDKDTVIEYVDDGTEEGRPVKCILVSASGFAWDQNIFLDNSSETGLAGQGYMTFIDMVPVLQILDSIDDKGPNYYYFGVRSVAFVEADKFNPNDTAYAYCASAGAMGDAAKQYGYYVGKTSEEPGTIGSDIWYMDASTFNGYPTIGLVGTGVLQGSKSEAFYKMNIGWFEEESMFGLKAVQGADGKYSVKEPAEWAAIEAKYYELLPEASGAPRRDLMAPNSDPRMEKLCKQFKAMKADRLYKK